MYVGSSFDFHPGIHSGILESLVQDFDVRITPATARCYCPDPTAFHLVDYFLYTRVTEFPREARFIYSAFYAVTNDQPWIVDMDDICLPVYHHNALYPGVAQLFRRQISESALLRDAVLSRIGAYATPHCRGILFHSQNALLRAKGLFEKLELDRSAEVSAFLAKARAVYPSLEPQSAKFMARTGKTPTILFMAGDFAEKGGDIALRVFDKLLERHTRANLVYVGPIPAEAKAAHQQTLSRIRYTDVVPRQEALALLASSDVLLVPTRYESFGFVFLEAMAHGCAPMTYWGEGFNVTRELIDADRTGVLLERPAEPLSAEAEASRFCEKLLELLENRARLKAMQQAALAEVAEGRFCLAKRNRLVRELLRAPPEPSTVEARYRSHRHICFEASTFEQMIDAYRRAHQIPRTLRI